MEQLTILVWAILTAMLAYSSAAATLALHFGLGAPSESMDYIEGNLLSKAGKWVLIRYARFEQAHPGGINPYKAVLCPYCLCQWVGLAIFTVFQALWHLPWECLILHNAMAHAAMLRMMK